jgi:hypothetical protein
MIRRPFDATDVADFDIDVRTLRAGAFRLQLEIRPRPHPQREAGWATPLRQRGTTWPRRWTQLRS